MLKALEMLVSAISQSGAWFLRILNAVDGFSIWLSAIYVFLVYRFIFAPLFGMAKSDLAKNSYNALKRGKEE